MHSHLAATGTSRSSIKPPPPLPAAPSATCPRLWAFFTSGATVERILKRYPQLGPAKVFDALAFALDNPEVMEADLRREQEILAKSGERPKRTAGAPEQIELPFAAPRPTERG